MYGVRKEKMRKSRRAEIARPFDAGLDVGIAPLGVEDLLPLGAEIVERVRSSRRKERGIWVALAEERSKYKFPDPHSKSARRSMWKEPLNLMGVKDDKVCSKQAQ